MKTKTHILSQIQQNPFFPEQLTHLRKNQNIAIQKLLIVCRYSQYGQFFDGHGHLGAKASKQCARDIQSKILDQINTVKDSDDEIVTKLKRIFEETNDSLVSDATKAKQEYGTTATIALLTNWVEPVLPPDADSTVAKQSLLPPKLIIGNVGDSRIVLFRPKMGEYTSASISDNENITISHDEESSTKNITEKTDQNNQEPPTSESSSASTSNHIRNDNKKPTIVFQGKLEVQFLTNDHNLEREDEKQRILGSTTGVILPDSSGVLRVCPPSKLEGYPTTKDGKPLGLNMTRALGHAVLRQHGVSPELEWHNAEVKPGDWIIAASDGLWDVIASDEMAEHIAKLIEHLWDSDKEMWNTNPSVIQQVNRILVREVADRCKMLNMASDNLTFVIVHFYS